MSPARSTRQSPGRAYAPARARKTATGASNEPRELPRDESHRTFFTHTLVAHRNQPHGTVRSSRQTAAHTVSILAHVPTAGRLRPQGHTSQTMQTPCPPSQVLGNAQSTPRHLGQHRPVSGQHVRRPLASRNSVALPSAQAEKDLTGSLRDIPWAALQKLQGHRALHGEESPVHWQRTQRARSVCCRASGRPRTTQQRGTSPQPERKPTTPANQHAIKACGTTPGY